ncbi:MAG: hypothetical protein LBG95_09010, partial [Treponema sp.]|nr:hypothetical protein [Treponema sp.]
MNSACKRAFPEGNNAVWYNNAGQAVAFKRGKPDAFNAFADADIGQAVAGLTFPVKVNAAAECRSANDGNAAGYGNTDDLITRIANVDYDKNVDCPAWKKFIMEIMNYNTDLIRFIQNAAGWAVTGDTSEQTMFILFGTGANGKST